MVSADVTVPLDPSGAGASIYAWGQAFETDYLTINAPGKTGLSATAYFTPSFHGAVYTNPGLDGPCFSLSDDTGKIFYANQTPGSAGCPTPATGSSGAFADAFYSAYENGANPEANDPQWWVDYSVLNHPTPTYLLPFTFGTMFELDQELSTYVNVHASSLGSPYDAPAAANATSNFADTAQITGIQIFDDLGNAVTDFTISSVSGLDYSASGVSAPAPVPEPASAALFGAALLGLFVRRHKLKLKKLVADLSLHKRCCKTTSFDPKRTIDW